MAIKKIDVYLYLWKVANIFRGRMAMIMYGDLLLKVKLFQKYAELCYAL